MYYNTPEYLRTPTLENYRHRLKTDEKLLQDNMDDPERRELLEKRIKRHKAAIAKLTGGA